MFTHTQQILNGPALAMIEYIRSYNIDIDTQRLEALDQKIRLQKETVSPEFLMESRRVREELKRWLEANQP
ncbi:hypothetical protein [Parendozoicomonas haliclonae]|uniref:Uncharacterized protein n=1 Tax=Parendozoicomonas haliclonae TaxID=1960125 RepID=A0A1X7AEC7_9GAMM|nr:hypothetical protein [Parendozoicomonas haliclonae]SMA32430.1 hypothetical protein EHSB41UT_00150 [Parendozoicomonas haliclonae]